MEKKRREKNKIKHTNQRIENLLCIWDSINTDEMLESSEVESNRKTRCMLKPLVAMYREWNVSVSIQWLIIIGVG